LSQFPLLRIGFTNHQNMAQARASPNRLRFLSKRRLHQYSIESLTRVSISDCPLVIASDNSAAGINSVTVKVELANHAMNDDLMFKVTWEVLDKNGLSGSLDIYNSFSLKPKVA
jgi:hypothetical protein